MVIFTYKAYKYYYPRGMLIWESIMLVLYLMVEIVRPTAAHRLRRRPSILAETAPCSRCSPLLAARRSHNHAPILPKRARDNACRN